MTAMSPDQVDRALSERLPAWHRDGEAITRSVELPAFLEGVALVVQVARVAESADHHPDIDIRWRTVTFALATHSEGGVTEKDLTLAAEIDQLVETGPGEA